MVTQFRRLIGGLAVVIGALVLSGSALAATSLPQNAAMKKLIKTAKKEGKLNINWGFSSPTTAKPLIAAFNAAYPRIKVTLTPNQNQPGNTAQLVQEYKAHQTASTDAFVGVPQLLWEAGPQNANALKKVNWAAFAPWTKGLATPDGVGLPIFEQYTAFVYNTKLFPAADLPNSAQDVLKLKEPVASTPYAAQFNVFAQPGVMGVDGLKSYLQAFRPAGFIGCGDLSPIADGQFDALWISCGANVTTIFAAQGAPLKNQIIKNGEVMYPWYAGVMKNAADPAAAELWDAFMETPQAQKIFFAQEKADETLIKGSQTEKQIKAYQKQGVGFVNANYQFVEQHASLFGSAFNGMMIGILTNTNK